MITINENQLKMIKANANGLKQYLRKKDLINKRIEILTSQIESLKNDINNIDSEIDTWDAGVKSKCNGLGTFDILERIFIPATNEDGTAKLDQNGQAILKQEFKIKNHFIYDEATKTYNFDDNAIRPADNIASI